MDKLLNITELENYYYCDRFIPPVHLLYIDVIDSKEEKLIMFKSSKYSCKQLIDVLYIWFTDLN